MPGHLKGPSEGRVAAIEAGGTTFVCAVGSSPEELLRAEQVVIETADPASTVRQLLDWLADADRHEPLAAIGIASFGPLDLPAGTISSSSPKIAWRGFDWRAAFASSFGHLPVAIDTDVNAAALAEWRWGAAVGRDVSAYLTVGTGIGGGIVLGGRPLHGLVHPEIGHLLVPRDPGDHFEGCCPSHGDCLEGLASGVAVEQRWGRPAPMLGPDHPAWQLEATYLATGIVDLVTVVAPRVVVLGGGVALGVPGLLDLVRRRTVDLLAGYLDPPELGDRIGEYLVAPGLGARSGVLGAWALGAAAVGAPAPDTLASGWNPEIEPLP